MQAKTSQPTDSTNPASSITQPNSTDAASATTDPVFCEEQEHLAGVYRTLQRIGREAVQRMENTTRQAEADRQAMAEELSVNLATYADAMETYADFEAMNRIVDAYNVSQASDAEKVETVALLLRQPDFAKVTLRVMNGASASTGAGMGAGAGTRAAGASLAEPREIYIGAAGISDDSCKKLVVDWRSPVAEVYYNQGTGLTSYEANGRIIEADLLLRRQFDIDQDRLLAYFDTTVAIQDPLLLASLSKNHSAAMSAITATIQQEQNAVIRHDDVPALLVIGAAGSGKTSVMMQRIAYLFYRNRNTLRASEVALVTPNPVFQSYIAHVLPDMGEENPRICTRDELFARLLPEGRGVGAAQVPEARLVAIDEVLATFEFASSDFEAVTCAGERFVSVGQLSRLSAKYGSIPAGSRRVTLMREEVLKRVEARLAAIAATEELRDELERMTLDEQTALFGAPLAAQSEAEATSSARSFVRKRYAQVFAMVERDEWININHVGARLLHRDGLTSLEWLYLKMGVTGMCDRDTKYVMLDEVQDYTAAQVRVLERYFRNARFLLLGDPNQAIMEGAATFDEIRAIFGAHAAGMVGGASAGGGMGGAGADADTGDADVPVAECLLPTSYRCTPQITELFARLVPAGDQMQISSVQRDGADPVVLQLSDADAYQQALVDAVSGLLEAEGTAAIIVPWRSDAKKLDAWLKEQLSGGAMGACSWTVVADKTAALPGAGVVIMPLELAKGLEFDAVLIPDASERVFPDDDLARRRLYTTISRATRELTILAPGKLTPLLA